MGTGILIPAASHSFASQSDCLDQNVMKRSMLLPVLNKQIRSCEQQTLCGARYSSSISGRIDDHRAYHVMSHVTLHIHCQLSNLVSFPVRVGFHHRDYHMDGVILQNCCRQDFSTITYVPMHVAHNLHGCTDAPCTVALAQIHGCTIAQLH